MPALATKPRPKAKLVLGPDSAGILLTPAEFDAVAEYDENYRYELIRGVLVVSPIPLAEERGQTNYWASTYETINTVIPMGRL